MVGVLEEEAKKTRDGGEVVSFLVADGSGSVELSLWDDIARAVQPGYVLHLKTAYRRFCAHWNWWFIF
jgi:ssDNA-binding replication factor A large subunit